MSRLRRDGDHSRVRQAASRESRPYLSSLRLAFPLAGALAIAPASLGENGAPAGEWRHYGADLASSRYSALDQIDSGNVTKLVEVWRWSAPDNEIYAKESRFRERGGKFIVPKDGIAII